MPATVWRWRKNRQVFRSFRAILSMDNLPDRVSTQGVELCYHCVRGGTVPGAPWKKKQRSRHMRSRSAFYLSVAAIAIAAVLAGAPAQLSAQQNAAVNIGN